MLEPQSRRLFMESLQPPAGYRLDWAVGTTYSLDLMALLAAPVAFAFSDWQDREGRPVIEPLALLKAVRQYANRICLFCQVGKIQVPRTYQPLLADLEDSIIGAQSPRGGSFHPKLWFLRYRDSDESVMYRLLCMSRNMTFDRSWDTLLCLEGPLQDRMNAIAANHPLGRFVEALPGMTCGLSQPLQDRIAQRVAQLAHEIRRVKWEIPPPFEDIAFHPMGIEERPSWPISGRVDRLLVISPFVDDGLLGDLSANRIPMRLVSRPESLACLNEKTLAWFEQVSILDDSAEPEPADAEETANADGEKPATDGAADAYADELPLVGLHAKLYVADAGWNARLWTGSANATRAAFRRNVEMLIELRGKRSRCGIDAVLGAAGEKGKGNAATLADLLQPYVRREGDQPKSPEEEAFQRAVDRVARELAGRAPVAWCDGGGSAADVYTVTLLPTRPGDVSFPSTWCLRARPISLPAAFLAQVTPPSETWVRFEGISLLALTSFYAFEVAAPEDHCGRFVLNLPLQNVPDDRRERILQCLLSDQDRVLRFLLLLLTDQDARGFGAAFGQPGETRGSLAFHFGLGSTLFESLVRALDRAPERIDQVAAVIDDLRKCPDSANLLPKDFDVIWQPIWQARERQLRATQSATSRQRRKHKRNSRGGQR